MKKTNEEEQYLVQYIYIISDLPPFVFYNFVIFFHSYQTFVDVIYIFQIPISWSSNLDHFLYYSNLYLACLSIVINYIYVIVIIYLIMVIIYRLVPYPCIVFVPYSPCIFTFPEQVFSGLSLTTPITTAIVGHSKSKHSFLRKNVS